MRHLLAVLLLAAALPGGALAQPARAPGPAQQLADDVTGLAARGYRLRGLQVSEQGSEIRLALTMATGQDARRLELVFADAGWRPLRYASRITPVPADVRVYPAEPKLLTLLAAGPPTLLRLQCGTWYLDGVRGRGASVDEHDYHVIERSVGADQAGALLSELLARALEDREELSWAGSAGDDPWAIDFELHGAAGRRVLRAQVDGSFRVVGLQVRVSPPTPVWQIYRRPGDLAAALRAGGRIHALVAEPDTGDHGRLVVRMRGKRFAIDLGEFDRGPPECPC